MQKSFRDYGVIWITHLTSTQKIASSSLVSRFLRRVCIVIGIYKITNKINKKSYIGQSINIQKRVHQHFWKAKCKKDVSYNSALHNAIRKYGQINFQIEILQECSVENIDEKEKYYIKYYNTLVPNGYNILSGGQKNRIIPRFCSCCGVQISKQGITGMCHKCYSQKNRKVKRPNRETLKKEIRTKTFIQLGKKYKVSDKAIVKWCKQYQLPFRKKDIKLLTEQQWQLI